MNNMSKADVLINLKSKLKKALIEDIHVFTVDEWNRGRAEILNIISVMFAPRTVIIRSSSINEDTAINSQAGCFHSELDIDSGNRENLSMAIEKVIGSYKDKGTISGRDQVIVQTQTRSISVSGVVFTRALGTNAPYYVINYDDKSGKTDTVTGGIAGEMVCVFRHAVIPRNNRWFRLIEIIREIESHFHAKPLDIEFAIKNNGDVVVFQVRLLAANIGLDIPDEDEMKGHILSMKNKYKRFSRPSHICGGKAIFGDMPDWNPAEMIGSRPNTLDYTLYSFLITDHVWHEARSTLGYKDVYPGELMTSFGKRPYIDARLSFNSFVPEDVPQKLWDKLVSFYIDDLEKHPEKQDKIEFEIVLSCFNFSLKKELERFKFTEEEKTVLKNSLFLLTKRIIDENVSKGNGVNFSGRDLDLIGRLKFRTEGILKYVSEGDDTPWIFFEGAYSILQNCKKLGVLPFSRLARMAFIGKNILISLKREGIISEESYHDFLNSIETVASGLNNDIHRLKRGEINDKDFLNKYGHLRPGTYDITAPRYVDMDINIFKSAGLINADNGNDGVKRFYLNVFPAKETERIDKCIKDSGFTFSADVLLTFIEGAIACREWSKLEFTKAVSAALECIVKGGEKLGLEERELCHADLGTLMKFRNPEYSDMNWARKVISQSIERHKNEKEWSDLLILPPVITSENDFDIVNFYKARPNFITNKTIQAPALAYDREKFLKASSLNEYIILLENADPGYDWIFTKSPAGIITKYGGVASHMAIRCAEFGIPAAIGCGVTIYDNLAKAGVVRIDCAKQVVESV